MTIKVYKKRTHWYYTYHCVEYDLGQMKLLNLFEKLLDKKVLYFTTCSGIVNYHARIVNAWNDHEYYVDPRPIGNLIEDWMYQNFKIPSSITDVKSCYYFKLKDISLK